MNLELGDTKLLIDRCKKEGLLRNQAAYVLASAYHESAHTMKPVREYGGETYLKKKKYYPYVGMGYIQLTWDYNYKYWSDRLKVDFLKNPKLLLDPEYASIICIEGMKDGKFTGKKLSDFITLTKSDYFNARSIVNGDKNYLSSDKKNKIGNLIAGYAKSYEADLIKLGYGVETPLEETQSPVQPIPPVPSIVYPEATETSPRPSLGFLELLKSLFALFTSKGS